MLHAKEINMHNVVGVYCRKKIMIFHCVGPLLHLRSVFVCTIDHQQCGRCYNLQGVRVRVGS